MIIHSKIEYWEKTLITIDFCEKYLTVDVILTIHEINL